PPGAAPRGGFPPVVGLVLTAPRTTGRWPERHGPGAVKRATAIAFAPLWLALGAVTAPGGKPKSHGDNVHRQDAECSSCHTADAATLARDPGAARQLLPTDLDGRCNVCHGDEGPSHPTSVRPTKAVPEILPLAGGGTTGWPTRH